MVKCEVVILEEKKEEIVRDSLVAFECSFCKERFMFESLQQVEVIRNTGVKLGSGNFVFICPFCISEREMETEDGEFLMQDYMVILYLDESHLYDFIKRSMDECLVDKMYLAHRKSLFEGWKPD